MRPFRSFLLLLLLLSCFTGLFYIIPGSPGLPGVNDLINTGQTLDTETRKSDLPSSGDSLSVSLERYVNKYKAPVNKDSLSYSERFTRLIEHRFDSVFKRGEQIRIIYYGDSQLEGDRITSYLRKELSRKYGGSGPGLFLPLMPVMYTKTLFIRASSNWRRYNYLSFRDGEIDHNMLGPFMTVCRYLPEDKTSEIKEKATVHIVKSNFADSLAVLFDRLRIFYGRANGTVEVLVRADSRIVCDDTLNTEAGIRELSVNLGRPEEVTIEFFGKVSPDIYGMSIEGEEGIIVDNIPQRGSAGLEFTMVDKNNLGEFYSLVKPDMFILQYGLNIVKSLRADYSYFENGLYRQIDLLKELCPSTPVLLMSLSDMAYRNGDTLRSYPNISIIRDAQKKAADKSGAGFWDSFEAMGGEASIISWSEKDPPLAEKDLVHLTYAGADTLAKLLIDSVFSYSDSILLQYGESGNKNAIAVADSCTLVAPDENPGGLRKVALSLSERLLTYFPDNPFIFTTAGFWIFFLFVLAGYSFVFRKLKLRSFYLLLVSYYFYYKTGGLFLFLLVIVTVVDYSCGWLIHVSRIKFKRKLFITISIVSNLALLAYFKYAGFVTDGINTIFGTHFREYDLLSSLSNSVLGTSFDINSIILPVGISFFTFQSLSYTIDIYRRKMQPVKSIIDFGFFVSFFPHLVAGPIVRASVFIPQIYQEFKLTSREFSHALFMISKGLIKKIVISNFIAINFVDRVFDAPALYSGFENLMAIYGYGLQIYCDFSGYTDIAIGVALVLGFRLPINFNSPYKAANITDFWKRWHISLSQWLKDYLYISLGGNRKGKTRTYINLMITMLLGGLWHGAALRFIIWGGLHGTGLVFNKIWKSFTGSLRGNTFLKIISVFITFNFVSFCWIFFRAEHIGDIRIMLNQIVYSFNPGVFKEVLLAYSSVLLIMAAGYMIHFLPENIKESYRGLFIKLPVVIQMTFILAVAVFLYQMRTTEVIPFIYFRF